MGGKKLKLTIIASVVLTALTGVLLFQCPWELSHYKTDQARYGHIPTLKTSLDIFYLQNRRLPYDNEGLKALFEKPESPLPKWQQVVKEVPIDPWGNDYYYKVDDSTEEGYVLYSFGPNGLDDFGGHDDVVSWDKEYSCELHYKCPTTCDYSLKIFVLVTPISWLITLGAILFSLYRFCKTYVHKKRLNKQGQNTFK